MTERLYYHDAFLTEFTATVTEMRDGGRRVYLDRTALYPTSGGQPHDTGTLGGMRVIDVIDEDEQIAHVLESPLGAGTHHVSASVDWTRRLDHMQQHTGQHLLSAVLADTGRITESVHFGDTTSTLDVAGEEPLDLVAAEYRANTLVSENRAIDVTFEDALAATGLRKRPDRTGIIRVITIDGLDRSACGGTHVRRTGEIGAILVRRAERTRGRTRVEFVCGLRAVQRARADLLALSTIAAGFSTGLDDAPGVVADARAQVASLRREVDHLAGELARRDAVARYEASPPDGRGRRLVVERRQGGGVDALRQLALAVAAMEGAVFIGTSDDPPAVLLASSPSSGIDAGATLKAALNPLSGRGGGSPRLAQGSLPSADLLPSVIDSIARTP
jgi:alanyl-tRNA synthetase